MDTWNNTRFGNVLRHWNDGDEDKARNAERVLGIAFNPIISQYLNGEISTSELYTELSDIATAPETFGGKRA